MMQQETSVALPRVSIRFKYPADVAFDVFGVETTHCIESQLTEDSGSMAQLPCCNNARCVVESRTLRLQSNAHRPNTSEPFKPDDHRRTFLSSAGFSSAPHEPASGAN